MDRSAPQRSKTLPYARQSHSLLLRQPHSDGALSAYDPKWTVEDLLAAIRPKHGGLSKKASRSLARKKTVIKALPKRQRGEPDSSRRATERRRLTQETATSVAAESSLKSPLHQTGGPPLSRSFYVGKSHTYSMGDALPLLEYYVGRYKMRCADLKEEQSKQKKIAEAQYEVERGLRVDVATKTSEIESLMTEIERKRNEWKRQEMLKAIICQAYNRQLDKLMKRVVRQRQRHNELSKVTINLQAKALRRSPTFDHSESDSIMSASSITHDSTCSQESDFACGRPSSPQQLPELVVAGCPEIEWTQLDRLHEWPPQDYLSSHPSFSSEERPSLRSCHFLPDFSDAHSSELDWAAEEERSFSHWLSSASANRLRKPQDWQSFLGEAALSEKSKSSHLPLPAVEDLHTSVGPSPTLTSGVSPLSCPSSPAQRKKHTFATCLFATEIQNPNTPEEAAPIALPPQSEDCPCIPDAHRRSPRSEKPPRAITQALALSVNSTTSFRGSCLSISSPCYLEIASEKDDLTRPCPQSQGIGQLPQSETLGPEPQTHTPITPEEILVRTYAIHPERHEMVGNISMDRDFTTSFMSGHSEPAPPFSFEERGDISPSRILSNLSSQAPKSSAAEVVPQRWRDLMEFCEKFIDPLESQAATKHVGSAQRTSSVPLRNTHKATGSRATLPARRVEDCHFAQMTSSFAAKLRKDSPDTAPESVEADQRRKRRSLPHAHRTSRLHRNATVTSASAAATSELAPTHATPFRGRAIQRARAILAKGELPSQTSSHFARTRSSVDRTAATSPHASTPPPLTGALPRSTAGRYSGGASPAGSRDSVNVSKTSEKGYPTFYEQTSMGSDALSSSQTRAQRPIRAIPLGRMSTPHFNADFRIISEMLTVPASPEQLFPCSIVRQH